MKAGDGARERRGLAASKQAVEVFFFLDLDHRTDGLAQQVGVGLHPAAIGRFLIESLASLNHGLVAPFAAGARQIEQALDLGVIVDDFALAVDVDEVVGVQAIVLVEVDA